MENQKKSTNFHMGALLRIAAADSTQTTGYFPHLFRKNFMINPAVLVFFWVLGDTIMHLRKDSFVAGQTHVATGLSQAVTAQTLH
jgi:hypothetical protein